MSAERAINNVALNRQNARAVLVAEIHDKLREWHEEALVLHPLPHGSFFEQIRREVNLLEAEIEPNGDRAARVARKKVTPALRGSVIKRDRHTCQRCGWKPDDDPAKRKQQFINGHFLVVEMVVSEHDGGKMRKDNLRTVCSHCTRGKPGRPGVTQAKNPKGRA